jgi:acyl-CoA thioester hydrolase
MDDRIARHLSEFPVVVQTPVAWGEMDAFGHVNNVVFFEYFENARIEYLARVAFGDRDRPDGVGPILHSTSARFRIPLRFPDTVWVGARTTEVGEDRLRMEYRVVSLRHAEVAADGSAVIVSFDYPNGEKVAVPGDVRSAIESLERR